MEIILKAQDVYMRKHTKISDAHEDMILARMNTRIMHTQTEANVGSNAKVERILQQLETLMVRNSLGLFDFNPDVL